jgi:type VI secretion system protein ImpA
MPAHLFDVEPLLQALADDAPCGPELDYDPDFQALERAGAGTPERQYGDKIFPAEPPEWQQVHELALGLAARTRDVRLGVWLTRSGARLNGLAGAVCGLQLVQGLLERQWAAVHPQLDASDNNDPTLRLNALAPLCALDAALADLREAGLAAVRGSLRVRDLELGLGKAEAHGDEAVPTEAGVLQGLSGLIEADANVASTLQAAAAAAQGIVAAVEAQVGSAAPDLSALTKLLALGPTALARLQPTFDASVEEGGDGAAGAGSGGGGSGGLRTRSDAARELERICDWLERNEPGHPAPLLLRRAQRLLNMTFIEIIQDMAPAAIDQVQTIAGPQPETS